MFHIETHTYLHVTHAFAAVIAVFNTLLIFALKAHIPVGRVIKRSAARILCNRRNVLIYLTVVSAVSFACTCALEA